MPKSAIREFDYTGSEEFQYLDFTVLVPGMILKDETHSIDGLYASLSQFKEAVASFAPESGDDASDYEAFLKDSAYIMAYELLNKGLSVQFAGAYKSDGTVEDNFNIANFYKEFEDKGKYDLRFITTGGFKNDDTVSDDQNIFFRASEEALKCAGNRGDAVACLYAPESYYVDSESGDSSAVVLNTSVLIDAWVNAKFESLANTNIERKFPAAWGSETTTTEKYGGYGAMFTPYVNNITVATTKDKQKLPGAFDYLACFANQLRTYAEWYATAGSKRGVSPYSNIGLSLSFGDSDVDIFESRDLEGHIATNPICNIRPYGNIIWGARTMYPLSRPYGHDDLPAQLTASSFLNIRQLCCTLKKVLYRASRKHEFDPNSDLLWTNFKSDIIPTLEEMKTNQGIRGYQIIKVPTKAKALNIARIVVTPIEPVEDFALTVELSDDLNINEG